MSYENGCGIICDPKIFNTSKKKGCCHLVRPRGVIIQPIKRALGVNTGRERWDRESPRVAWQYSKGRALPYLREQCQRAKFSVNELHIEKRWEISDIPKQERDRLCWIVKNLPFFSIFISFVSKPCPRWIQIKIKNKKFLRHGCTCVRYLLDVGILDIDLMLQMHYLETSDNSI